MTTPEEQALTALRRLNRPHQPDASAHARIEAQILERFDDVVTATRTTGDIESLDGRLVPTPPKRRGASRVILVAAALAILVAGLVVASTWRSDHQEVPSTQPTIGSDETLVAEQLREYCEAFLPPIDAAAERFAGGLGSDDARTNLVVTIEQAAQGLVDLSVPAQQLAAAGAERLLEAAADARLALALEIDENDTANAALDILNEVIVEIDGAEDVAACRRS